MYKLVLYITVIASTPGGVVQQQQPSVQVLREFTTLRECYAYAREMRLNPELYSCLPKNP